MNHYFLFSFLIILLLSSCATEVSKNQKLNRIEKYIADEITDWSDLNLQGKVKSLIEYEIPTSHVHSKDLILFSIYPEFQNSAYDTSFSKLRGQTIVNSHLYLFNESGNVYKDIYHSQNQMKETYYTFDSEEKLLELTEYDVEAYSNKEKELKKNISLQYNYRGQVNHICLKEFYHKKTINNIDVIYDGNNINTNILHTNLETGDTIDIGTMITNKNGEIFEEDPRQSFYYDKNGNLIKDVFKSDIGNHTTLYNYDFNENLVQKTTYDSRMEYVTNESYLYNDDGKLIMKIDYDNYSTTTESYLPCGQISKYKNISISAFDSIPEYSEQRYFYDEFDNLLRQEFIGVSYSLRNYEYKYTFDHYNNWTEQRSYRDDSLAKVERREIIYFK